MSRTKRTEQRGVIGVGMLFLLFESRVNCVCVSRPRSIYHSLIRLTLFATASCPTFPLNGHTPLAR